MRLEEMIADLMHECRKAPTQEPHARFSNALGCLRAHVYDFRLLDAGKWPQTVERPARWNFAAMAGSAIGWLMESAAERLGAKTQHHAVLDGIHGDLDIEWLDYVLDLKWVGEFAWREVKKAAKAAHAAQVNAYAVARGKPRWAVVYLPLAQLGKGEALEWIAHEGMADAEKAQRDVTERWALVQQHRAAGTLPKREVEKETCFRLQCLHRTYCWETQ